MYLILCDVESLCGDHSLVIAGPSIATWCREHVASWSGEHVSPLNKFTTATMFQFNDNIMVYILNEDVDYWYR